MDIRTVAKVKFYPRSMSLVQVLQLYKMDLDRQTIRDN